MNDFIEELGCRIQPLAENEMVKIERCSCGQIHVHIGSISLRVNPRVLDQIASATATARVKHAHHLSGMRTPTMPVGEA